jgi:hypothetical protein
MSRDNALVKIILSELFEELMQHLENYNFMELMLGVMKKGFASKKTQEKCKKMIEIMINGLGCENLSFCCQSILCGAIYEDEIYAHISKQIGIIFETIEKGNDKVIVAGFKVIKNMLEKEKDLKFIDEDCWGCEQVVESLTNHFQILDFQVKNEKNERILTSMGIFIEPAGEKTLVMLEIFTLIIEMNQSVLNSMILDNKVLVSIGQVFEKYPWNSFVHVSFINFASSALRSALNNDFARVLCDIVQKYCVIPPPTPNSIAGILPFCWKAVRLLHSSSEIYTNIDNLLEGIEWWPVVVRRLIEKVRIEEAIDPIISHRVVLNISKNNIADINF